MAFGTSLRVEATELERPGDPLGVPLLAVEATNGDGRLVSVAVVDPLELPWRAEGSGYAIDVALERELAGIDMQLRVV